MGGLVFWHWVIVALVILVLFGRGKISQMMGDFGKGVSSFKKGPAETEDYQTRGADPAAAAAPAPPADPLRAAAEAQRHPPERLRRRLC